MLNLLLNKEVWLIEYPQDLRQVGIYTEHFIQELTQSATTADTVLIMSAETTDFSVGVSIVDKYKNNSIFRWNL